MRPVSSFVGVSGRGETETGAETGAEACGAEADT